LFRIDTDRNGAKDPYRSKRKRGWMSQKQGMTWDRRTCEGYSISRSRDVDQFIVQANGDGMWSLTIGNSVYSRNNVNGESRSNNQGMGERMR
jgi:hypothetical protein